MDTYLTLMMWANLLWIPLAIIYLPGIWRTVGRRRSEAGLEQLCERVLRPNQSSAEPAHRTSLGYHHPDDPHCPERLRNGASRSGKPSATDGNTRGR